MIIHQTDSQSVSEIAAAPPCTHRSLTYYLSCGEYFAAQKPSLTKDAWKEFKARSGGSFTDNCLKIHRWWGSLSEHLQHELENSPFPSYLPLNGTLNLVKVPIESLSECLKRFRDSLSEEGDLPAKNVSAIAKLFHIKRKTYLVLEEIMTLDDWGLIARKFKLNPESLAPIQQRAQQLALHETVFTDQAVQALSELGYHPLRVLPKPKKKFTERDLTAKVDESVESYRQEKEYWQQECVKLQQRIEELQMLEGRELNGNGSSPDERVVDDFVAMYAEEVGEVGHSLEAKSEIALLESRERAIAQEENTGNYNYTPGYSNPTFTGEEPIIGHEEIRLKQKSEGDSVKEETQEVDLAKKVAGTSESSIASLKDLKGCSAIALFDKGWQPGELMGQNGSGRTVWFKKAENNKLYSYPFNQVQVQVPEYGDRYYLLSEFIEEQHLKVEDKKNQRGFLDLLSK